MAFSCLRGCCCQYSNVCVFLNITNLMFALFLFGWFSFECDLFCLYFKSVFRSFNYNVLQFRCFSFIFLCFQSSFCFYLLVSLHIFIIYLLHILFKFSCLKFRCHHYCLNSLNLYFHKTFHIHYCYLFILLKNIRLTDLFSVSVKKMYKNCMQNFFLI